MDGWNTIVSRCFSFSLGYVSFLEGGEWFLRGYRRSRVKLLGANICSLSTIMAQVNHGVPDTDSRFLYKIGIVLFKTKKQWWVFSRVLSQNVKSVLLRKNLRYVGYYIGFFPCPPFNGESTYKGLQAFHLDRFVEKMGAERFPSFPNAQRRCSL